MIETFIYRINYVEEKVYANRKKKVLLVIRTPFPGIFLYS